MPKKEIKETKKPEGIPGIVNQEDDGLDDILGLGEGEGDGSEEGTVTNTNGEEEKKPLGAGKISKEKLIKAIEEDPELAKEILGIGKEEKVVSKKGGDKLDKLVDIITVMAQNMANGQAPAGRPVSNELQNVLATAERQAMANITKYQKQFAEEVKKGQTGELLIYPAYSRRLPTSSIKSQNADGSFNVKTTKFEIGFRGVLLSFTIGQKYKGVPNSIIEFINRKVAAYQDVVKGKGSKKLADQAFDIKKNAA